MVGSMRGWIPPRGHESLTNRRSDRPPPPAAVPAVSVGHAIERAQRYPLSSIPSSSRKPIKPSPPSSGRLRGDHPTTGGSSHLLTWTFYLSVVPGCSTCQRPVAWPWSVLLSSSFADLGVSAEAARSLRARGITSAFPIQALAIPP